MFLFFFLQLAKSFLESFFETFDESFVLALDFGNLDFSFVKDFVFDFESVAGHGESEPGLQAVLHSLLLVVFFGLLFHPS